MQYCLIRWCKTTTQESRCSTNMKKRARRWTPSRLRKKSVRVEIGGIFGDIKSSPATHLTFLGQLCAIYFSRFLPKRLFPQPARGPGSHAAYRGSRADSGVSVWGLL